MDPSCLDPCRLDREGWNEALSALSIPAAPGGSWRAFPHLSSRRVFSERIRERANLVLQVVRLFGDGLEPDCQLCQIGGGYAEHLGGPRHWSRLCDFLGEGPVESHLEGFWNMQRLRGGWLRLNELDGRLQICKGADFPATAGLKPPCGQLPAGVAPPPDAPTRGAELPSCASLAQEGSWVEICEPLSWSARPKADWRLYAHLGSQRAFREGMRPRAEMVVNAMSSWARMGWIAPSLECRICDGCRGYEEHLGGPKHYATLSQRYMLDGVAVEEVREQLWNSWPVPGGRLRINELDGAIQMLKGELRPPHAPPHGQHSPPRGQRGPPRFGDSPSSTVTFAARDEDMSSVLGVVGAQEEAQIWSQKCAAAHIAWQRWWCKSVATHEKLENLRKVVDLTVVCSVCSAATTDLRSHVRTQHHFERLMLQLSSGKTPHQRVTISGRMLLLRHEDLTLLDCPEPAESAQKAAAADGSIEEV
ncbi:unnamed protein product [Effrenium voratum]|nr:unnamed protein product [Effrenium voratum]